MYNQEVLEMSTLRLVSDFCDQEFSHIYSEIYKITYLYSTLRVKAALHKCMQHNADYYEIRQKVQLSPRHLKEAEYYSTP